MQCKRKNRVIRGNKRKIRELQAELECNHEESKAFEIFSDLYHKRFNALYELDLKARKPEKSSQLDGRTDLTINKN